MDLASIDVTILCGGRGERLRPAIQEGLKVMAPLSGRPFLDLILDYLRKAGFRRVVLLTGYKAEMIEDYYRRKGNDLTIEYCREPKPLGTGGAIKNARRFIKSDPFIVLNGDSFCPLDYEEFLRFHFLRKAWGSVVLSKAHEESDQDFGVVVLDDSRRILDFEEKPLKKVALPGLRYVNCGIYCFPEGIFQCLPVVPKFSLENDLFKVLLKKGLYGFVTEERFFDIGTPQRYEEAKTILGPALASSAKAGQDRPGKG